MTEAELSLLAGRMTERFGLAPRDGWASELEAGVRDLAARTRLPARQVIEGVLADGVLAVELAQHLTVGETHFLRCAPHFESLASFVAERLRTLPPDRRVAIVSAGCATGEEPYSVAIAVAAYLGEWALERIDVLGIDLNRESIACAREARYRPWSFRGAPPWLLARYTRPAGDAREIVPAILRPVRFEQAAILERLRQMEAGSVDAVLFRNVAIYLSASTLGPCYAEIARVLREGGLLAVSPSDPRPADARLASLPDATTSLYRRVDAGAVAAGAAAVAPEARPAAPRAVRTPSAPARRAAAPRRVRIAPAPARAPSRPAAPVDASAIRALADRGERGAALEATRQWARREPDAAGAYLLCGQLLLEESRVEQALEELRKAVFLAGADPLTRFWYASGLLAARRLADSRRQLSSARKLLVELGSDSVLSDGETLSGDLDAAAAFLEESLT